MNKIEIKIHNFQIIANDFIGFTNLCFRNVCNFSASTVGYYGLVDPKTGPIGFIMALQ